MSTGTIQTEPVVVLSDIRSDILQLGFTNDSGETLTIGQEVVFKGDGTLARRTDGSEPMLGIIARGGEVGEKVAVRTLFSAVATVIAKDTLNAGDLVVPGDFAKNEDGLTSYRLANQNEYCSAIVVDGGDINTQIKVGILDAVIYMHEDASTSASSLTS